MENIMPYLVAERAYENEIADIESAASKIRGMCPFEKLHDWLEIESSILSTRDELWNKLSIIRKKIRSTVPAVRGPFRNATVTVLTEEDKDALREAMHYAAQYFDPRTISEIEQEIRAEEGLA